MVQAYEKSSSCAPAPAATAGPGRSSCVHALVAGGHPQKFPRKRRHVAGRTGVGGRRDWADMSGLAGLYSPPLPMCE